MVWYGMRDLPNLVEPSQKLLTSYLGGSIKSSEVTTPVGKGRVLRPDGVLPAPLGGAAGRAAEAKASKMALAAYRRAAPGFRASLKSTDWRSW